MSTGRMVRVLVLGALAAGVVYASGPIALSAATARQPVAQRWYQRVVADLQPLQSGLTDGLQAAVAWQQGSQGARNVRDEMARDLPQLQRVYASLEHLAPLTGFRQARNDYVEAIGLYVDAFEIEQVAAGTPEAELVTQLQRSFERIRELGDETFDQGTAELAPLLGQKIAGADLDAASHVPDWTSLGLAPGAPLVTSWGGTVTEPSGPPSARAWVTAVKADGAPAQSSVRAALSKRVAGGRLAGLAVALDRAEVSLGSTAVPPKDVAASFLLRLGLLVDAEAALAGQAGEVPGTGATQAHPLEAVAQALAYTGGALRSASGTGG